MNSKATKHVDEMQYGFRKGKGTKVAIFLLRMIMEKAIKKADGYIKCFIDQGKAVVTVKHGLLVDGLRRFVVDDKDIRSMARLY